MKDIYKQLTIILAIRDNHKMTTRWLDYAVRKKVQYKIIIADGSKHKFLLKEEFKNSLDVKIVYSDYDKDHYTFMKKFSNVLNNHVNTEFCLLADNDDFHIFTEIEKHLKFLLNNKDYAACCGSILKFELKEIYFGEPKFTTLSKLRDLQQEKPTDRLCELLEPCNFREVYYDLMYSKFLRKAVDDFLRLNNNDVNYHFLQFYILVAVVSSGKLKSFDDIFLARQEDYQSSTSNYESVAHKKKAGNSANSTTSLGTWESVFMPNWSLNYFNLLNYAFTEFDIDKNHVNDRKLITNKFNSLFQSHITEKIIKGGNYKITLMSFLRSNFKKFLIFKIMKNFKESYRKNVFYIFHYQLLKKMKDRIFY